MTEPERIEKSSQEALLMKPRVIAICIVLALLTVPFVSSRSISHVGPPYDCLLGLEESVTCSVQSGTEDSVTVNIGEEFQPKAVEGNHCSVSDQTIRCSPPPTPRKSVIVLGEDGDEKALMVSADERDTSSQMPFTALLLLGLIAGGYGYGIYKQISNDDVKGLLTAKATWAIVLVLVSWPLAYLNPMTAIVLVVAVPLTILALFVTAMIADDPNWSKLMTGVICLALIILTFTSFLLAP